MINAPALVLTAAGLSVIAKGGFPKAQSTELVQSGTTFRFWFAIIAATSGIILIDRWDSNLAKGMASLWLVGGVVANGPTISKWLGGFAEGLGKKN